MYMGLHTDVIRRREENNIALEKYADESLVRNKHMITLEDEVDNAQISLMYILERFGISANRIYGKDSISSMIETILDPLGIMFDYDASISKRAREKTEYILAFTGNGKSVALFPTIKGYMYYSPHNAEFGRATKKWCAGLKSGGYIIHRPIEEKKNLVITFIVNVLKCMTVYDILKLFLAVAAATGLGYIIPAVSRWIYKVFLGEGGTMAGFGFGVAVFSVAALIRALLTAAKSLITSGMILRISLKIQAAVMAKVLVLPQSFFNDNSSGRLSRRIANCGRLCELILNFFIGALLDLVFAVVYLFQMKSFASELMEPAIIFVGVRLVISVIIALENAINARINMEADMENSSLLYSSIRGIQRIKGMGAEQVIYAKWADIYRRILSAAYNQPFFLKYSSEIQFAINLGTTVVLLAVCLSRNVSAADYMSFTASYSLVVTAVTTLTDVMKNFFMIGMMCDNVRPLFTDCYSSGESMEYVRSLNGDIVAENIRFGYDDSTSGCLQGISLNIKKGEKIAIVGESGCGKSTLLKLLIGMESPTEGTILYDGKPLSTLNQKSLRRKIGSVFQFSKVFPGTITSNVLFGAGGRIDEDEIWKAVDMAEIGDYLRTLPLKLDTEISESNSNGFSGGQRQQILLARALVRHPSVLILDEATSALDNLTQSKVLNNILSLRCTVIMVAHRLSTVAGFDRIIMLDQGKIIEDGTYEELMAKNGRFAALVEKQLLHLNEL